MRKLLKREQALYKRDKKFVSKYPQIKERCGKRLLKIAVLVRMIQNRNMGSTSVG